eukprot:RCo007868
MAAAGNEQGGVLGVLLLVRVHPAQVLRHVSAVLPGDIPAGEGVVAEGEVGHYVAHVDRLRVEVVAFRDGKENQRPWHAADLDVPADYAAKVGVLPGSALLGSDLLVRWELPTGFTNLLQNVNGKVRQASHGARPTELLVHVDMGGLGVVGAVAVHPQRGEDLDVLTLAQLVVLRADAVHRREQHVVRGGDPAPHLLRGFLVDRRQSHTVRAPGGEEVNDHHAVGLSHRLEVLRGELHSSRVLKDLSHGGGVFDGIDGLLVAHHPAGDVFTMKGVLVNGVAGEIGFPPPNDVHVVDGDPVARN